MKYRIGDVVKIREDLELYTHYYMEGSYTYAFATNDMIHIAGNTATITAIRNGMYLLNIPTEGRVRRVWTDEMFEGSVQQTHIELSPDDLFKFLTSNQ